jgi:GntR family transcriptional regulator of arabinose operon
MTKHRKLFELLQHQILTGHYAEGRRLPSETELTIRYDVSRPTAARALKDLQQMGVITRRPGSGSYLKTSDVSTKSVRGKVFALLVPGLGRTEILDPICNEITRYAQSLENTVLWGDAAQPIRSGEDAIELCRQYIARGVDGVFFAPMELVSDRAHWNERVVSELGAAGIPLVLLDRDLREFPERSAYDLVGIDNFRAGIAVAKHVLERGSRRICFVARPAFPSTTNLRLAGCRDAVRIFGQEAKFSAATLDPTDRSAVQTLWKRSTPDACLCANDQTAALLLRTLTELGVRTPQDVRLAGFDDVEYATLLAVPLTSIRQPCRDIARAATAALLERTIDNTLPARQILLPHELVVRASTD